MSQPRLILHIGARKTGSSYLQHCFSVVQTELADAGIIYAEHESVARAARGDATGGNGISLARFLREEVDEEDQSALDAVEHSMRAAHGRDVLLSSEFLAALTPSRFAYLAERVDAAGYRIVFVFYVRSVAGAALSAYKQRVKRHLETCDFTQWLSEQYRFRMGDTARKLIGLVGRDAIQIHNFDRVRGNLYVHFARHALNDAAARIEVPRQVVNRSLSSAEVELMRHINGLLSDVRQGALAGHTLTKAPVSESVTHITAEQHKLLQDQARDQIALLNEMLPPADPIDVLGPGMQVNDEPPPALSEREKMLARLVATLIAERSPR